MFPEALASALIDAGVNAGFVVPQLCERAVRSVLEAARKRAPNLSH